MGKLSAKQRGETPSAAADGQTPKKLQIPNFKTYRAVVSMSGAKGLFCWRLKRQGFLASLRMILCRQRLIFEVSLKVEV